MNSTHSTTIPQSKTSDKENVKPSTVKKVAKKTSTLSKPTLSTAKKSVKAPETTSTTKQPLSSSTAKKSTVVKRPLSTSSTTSAPKRLKSTETTSSKRISSIGTTSDVKKARPAWDIKGRLQDMESVTSLLQGQVDSLSNKLVEREGELKKTAETKIELEVGLNTFQKECEETKEKNIELMSLISQMESRHKIELDSLNASQRSLQSSLESTEIALRVAKDNIYNLTFLNEQHKEKINHTDNLLTQSTIKLESSESTSELRRQKIVSLESLIEELKERIIDLETQSRNDEEVRRKLHNSIQELKGNIRVFCRVRPLLSKESTSQNITYVFPKNDSTSLEIIQKQNKKDVTGTFDIPDKVTSFKYDKVFSPSSKQSEVFEEISHLVQSSLDGYHTCIFAYGQTGSGKTFTMEGPSPDELNDDNEGMISRAVSQIFETAEKLKDKGWIYEMHASFLEIYNESIRDLLDGSNKKCEIKHDVGNQISVSNLKIVKVHSIEKVRNLLKLASKNRSQAETLMNERSSRSHSVFQLRLNGRNDISDQRIDGLMNLIDLAGSERLAQSGAKGDRLKETQCINKSLSCLGNVIASLANKDKHIPYRDSKLTDLLQNSLGGNSKTLMFVNISPTEESVNETLNSLRFASKVNACEIGTARKNGKIDLSN